MLLFRRRVQDQALKQNITTLHNRINELGVAEPVIQQQGLDRIVVQLPGRSMTSAVEDAITGYPVTGAGRMLTTVLTGAGIIIGVAGLIPHA